MSKGIKVKGNSYYEKLMPLNPVAEKDYKDHEEWKRNVDEGLERGPFPMLSDNAREQVCVNLAYNLVEERLRAGVATPSEICQLLKTGSSLAKLQMKQAEMEQKLTASKIKSLESLETQSELLKAAMEAFGQYRTSLDAVDNDQELGDEQYDFQN